MAPATARTMLGIMRGVTEAGGTARQAAIEGYTVAGKTGTAQKAANGHYDPNKYVASFVGVVPADDPRLAIIVVVDEPQGGHLGGVVAAPIFKEIAERGAALPARAAERAVARRKSGKAGAQQNRPRWRAAEARPAAEADESRPPRRPATELPLDDDALGDDPALAEQWDEVAGAEGRRGGGSGGRVGSTVPDFAGMSLGQAIRAAHKSGVELAFDDPEGRATGVALRQRPAPGPAPAWRGLPRGLRTPANDGRRL